MYVELHSFLWRVLYLMALHNRIFMYSINPLMQGEIRRLCAIASSQYKVGKVIL